MICAYCKSLVDDDSYYCDQCGQEIMLCEACNTPGISGFCQKDGEPLIPAKIKNGSTIPLSDTPSAPKTNVVNSPAKPPVLQLVNNQLGLQLDAEPGLIIGRTSGGYASRLGGQPKISGKHAELMYDETDGWKVQDLGSTNQTAVSIRNDDWSSVPKLKPYTPTALLNNSFLLIANIEFRILINGIQPSNKTERL